MRIQRTLIGIGLTILFLVVNATFSVVSLRELADHEQNVARTHKILLKLERTISHLHEAESSHQGYLEVNDPRHLVPFRVAVQAIIANIHDLRQSTSDNPRQQERLLALHHVTDERVRAMHDAINRGRIWPVVDRVEHAQHGSAAIRRSRDLIDEIRAEEEEQLHQRSARAHASRVGALASIVLSTLAGLGLVLLAWRLIREEMRVREEAHRVLSENAERMRKLALVASRTDNSVVITDARRRIEWVNDGFTRLTGYSSDEVLGRTPAELLQGPETDPQAIARMREGLQRGEGFQMELLNYTKGGRGFWNLVDVQPVLDDGGRPVNYIAVQRDISERKRFEEEIRTNAQALELANLELSQLYSEAEASNRAKSEFVANMSHEIRTPMSAILGYAELLLDPANSESQRRDSVLAIRRNGMHLLQLINDILDLSRIEAGKLKIEPSSVAPARVLFDVTSMMKPRAAERGLTFDLEFAGPIPEVISTDPTRLRQILINLIGNAIRFTDQGGVTVRCRFVAASSADDSSLEIEVLDTGIGISPEQLKRLFQPFAQADGSAARRFGGTGLGLYISQRLAEALGGKICVESAAGRGSRFTVSLPVCAADGARWINDPQDEANTPGASCDSDESDLDRSQLLQGRRILLADDGRDNQYLISLFLRSAGAEVDVVDHGQAAIDTICAAQQQNRLYDLVLMDMQMPQLDGYAATARLRDEGYQGPIVALTAHAMAGDREKCLAAGCTDYLSKPVTRDQLLRGVAANLSASGDLVSPTEPAPGEATANEMGPSGRLVSRYADDPQMIDAVARFVGRLSQRVDSLLEAVQTNDRERLIREAHQLKGAAGGYGFDSITDAAGTLEARLKDDAEINANLVEVEDLIDLCRRATARADIHS